MCAWGALARGFHRREAMPQRRIVVFGVDIRADDERNTLAEQRQRRRNAPRNFQRLGFAGVMQRSAETRAVAESGLDLLPEMGDVDDDVVEAGRDEALDLPRDQRLATGLEQRLGARVGQWPHAFAAARGKDHRASRSDRLR